MKKKSLSEFFAEKAFKSEKVQRSWEAHARAFRPIMEPAFVNDPQSRLQLLSALNCVSRKDLASGIRKLQQLEPACVTDADKAAYLFFMAVTLEMAGDKAKTAALYAQCCTYSPRYHLPYLKAAKAAHNDAAFDAAATYYLQALECEKDDEITIASIHTNLASCLTMMHRLKDAEAELALSKQVLPHQPGRFATEAILFAAKGDAKRAAACLENTDGEAEALIQTAKDMTSRILAGRHPHFSVLPCDTGILHRFWAWFSDSDAHLQKLLAAEDYDELSSMLAAQLKPAFPYVQRELEFGFDDADGKLQIVFADFYMAALRNGFEKLIACCPENIKSRWNFTIQR